MFTTGAVVVHRRYGAGTVIGIRKIKREGQVRRYFCVEMVGDAGTLMIPEQTLQGDDMRPALRDMKLIKKVLFKPPEELEDNHRSRQTLLEQKLDSREPRQIVQVLRDLCWRQCTGTLTTTDTRLRRKALTSLLEELVLSPSFSLAQAQEKLDALIDQAMAHHLALAETS